METRPDVEKNNGIESLVGQRIRIHLKEKYVASYRFIPSKFVESFKLTGLNYIDGLLECFDENHLDLSESVISCSTLHLDKKEYTPPRGFIFNLSRSEILFMTLRGEIADYGLEKD
ncbi:MAG: hypothetical protein AABY22_34805 [Nanoarchaeota archaeon]